MIHMIFVLTIITIVLVLIGLAIRSKKKQAPNITDSRIETDELITVILPTINNDKCR